MERLLHELLHHFVHDAYPIYGGRASACEEYEIRVLTDLLMREYFPRGGSKYQGMHTGITNDERVMYNNYLGWLDAVIGNYYYDIETFKIGFKKYGVFCMIDIEGGGIEMAYELNGYMPILLQELWFDYRRMITGQ